MSNPTMTDRIVPGRRGLSAAEMSEPSDKRADGIKYAAVERYKNSGECAGDAKCAAPGRYVVSDEKHVGTKKETSAVRNGPAVRTGPAGHDMLVDGRTLELIERFVPTRDGLEALGAFFAALSDETRLRILSALSISPMCVGDISAALGINRTTVSHQLGLLRGIGAVSCRRQGKISFYSIRDKRLLDVMLCAVEFIS